MSVRSVVLLVAFAAICAEIPLSSAFGWVKDPGTEITRTYPNQKTVVLRWEWKLTGSEKLSAAKIQRYKTNDKDNTVKLIGNLYFDGSVSNNPTNNTHFNLSGQVGTAGGSNGYIELTIYDINNQGYNKDNSKVDVTVSDYTYDCDMTIIGGDYSKSTKLIVYVLPGKPVLQLKPDKSVFCRNDTINITCNGLSGYPPPKFTFLQNDSTIGMLNGTTSGNYTKAVLSHALTQPGTLKFSCKATNDVGSPPTSNVVTITVKDPPVITNCKNKTVFEKENLVWTCDIRGSLSLNTSWFKGNTGTVFQSGKSLSIDDVNRNDSGKYIFTASNKGECPTASKTVYLDVQLKQYRVSGNCRFMNYTWVKGMGDINSNVSKTYQSILGNVIEEGYKGYKYFKSVKVLSLYKRGSAVIVNFQLELTANVSDPLLPLKEALNNSGGALGGYSIDPNSIQQGIYVPPTTPPASTTTTTSPPPTTTATTTTATTTTTTSPPKTKSTPKSSTIGYVAIILIALACCVLLILVIAPVVYCCYCKKRRECKVAEDGEDVIIVVPMEGIDNKGSSHSPSTYAKHGPGTNNAENGNEVYAQVDKSKHGPGANGNNNSENGTDVYAKVDKSKHGPGANGNNNAENSNDVFAQVDKSKHGSGANGNNNAEKSNDVDYAQAVKSKHGPGANGNNNAENSNDVFAQVDKSKKTKKPTEEVLYADLSHVRGDNKSGAAQLAPMTSSGNQPEKHESDYAEVIAFRSSEKPIGNESANNSNKNEKNPEPSTKDRENTTLTNVSM